MRGQNIEYGKRRKISKYKNKAALARRTLLARRRARACPEEKTFEVPDNSTTDNMNTVEGNKTFKVDLVMSAWAKKGTRN